MSTEKNHVVIRDERHAREERQRVTLISLIVKQRRTGSGVRVLRARRRKREERHAEPFSWRKELLRENLALPSDTLHKVSKARRRVCSTEFRDPVRASETDVVRKEEGVREKEREERKKREVDA